MNQNNKNTKSILLLLQEVVSDKLDSRTFSSYAEVMERSKYLQLHKYKIWKSETDGFWRTYYLNEQGKRKMKKLKHSEDMIDFVIEYVQNNEAQDLTVKDIFPMWIETKKKSTNSPGYLSRILFDWRKFYLSDSDFINKPIKEMTKRYLKDWSYSKIIEYQLTSKAFGNMALILREIFDLASDEEFNIIERNIFREINFKKAPYTIHRKKKSQEEVYTDREKITLINEAWKMYRQKKEILYLGIVLCFSTGVRVGELCALQFEDVEPNFITVQNELIEDGYVTEDFKFHSTGYKLVNYLKCGKLERKIPLSDFGKQAIKEIQDYSTSRNIPMDSFMFLVNGRFVYPRVFEERLQKLCDNVNIKYRSIHKIRKTICSTLVGSGVNINTVREIMGHSDEKTTLRNYTYDTKEATESDLEVIRALSI